MIKRTLSTIGLWGITIFIPLFFGSQGLVWLLTVLGVLTQYEAYDLFGRMGFRPQVKLGCVLGVVIMMGTWYLPEIPGLDGLDAGHDIFAMAVILVSLTLLHNPDYSKAKAKIMPTLLGLLLVPYMLHFYVRLIRYYATLGLSSTGILLTFWLIAVAKFTDVGGLILGTQFGRRKLAPEISPKKTWEGALGGVLVASLVGFFLCLLFRKISYMPLNFKPMVGAVMAIPVAVITVTSDLFESVIKRQAQVKDSGNLIPGIGGAFDLSDSLLFSAPLGYIIFKYILF